MDVLNQGLIDGYCYIFDFRHRRSFLCHFERISTGDDRRKNTQDPGIDICQEDFGTGDRCITRIKYSTARCCQSTLPCRILRCNKRRRNNYEERENHRQSRIAFLVELSFFTGYSLRLMGDSLPLAARAESRNGHSLTHNGSSNNAVGFCISYFRRLCQEGCGNMNRELGREPNPAHISFSSLRLSFSLNRGSAWTMPFKWGKD
jgi:hypothetical protein